MDDDVYLARSNTFFDETFASNDLFASATFDDGMNITPSTTGSTPDTSIMNLFGHVEDTSPDVPSKQIHSKLCQETSEKMLKTSSPRVKKIIKQNKNVKKKVTKFKPTNLVLASEADPIDTAQNKKLDLYNCDDANGDDQRDAFSQQNYMISTHGSFVTDDLRISSSGISELIASQTQSQPSLNSPPRVSYTTLDSPVKRNSPRAPKVFDHRRKSKEIRYENLKEISVLGQGASGSVMLVKDVNGQQYAKKSITIGYNVQTKLISTEVKALHKCRDCQYVIKFYDAFYRDDKIHLILEFMNGNSLESLLKEKKQIPENVLRFMTIQILKGLHYLHNKRIVHRDFKPANVLVNKQGDVKISDFGLTGIFSRKATSKQIQDQQIASAPHYGTRNPMVWNTCQGTILYMSPERIREQPHSFNSDVWSLGITLAELRMGTYPFFHHSSYFDIIEEIKKLEKAPIVLPENTFSPAFDSFIKSCIVVDPSKRPSSSQLLAHHWICDAEDEFDEKEQKQIIEQWMNTVQM
ncbi:mitogen-activated protein kinase kinase MAPKK [Acrasis kona]|uniref:mitogen-activated protein kinase kinase n=1 Tax=Acrasis kona TaxID=1008807 RepID=A0AAW2ZND3_9EUKA